MTGKGKSRWADSAEDAALEAQLKKEKEEKKRLKAEKARKAAEAEKKKREAEAAAAAQRRQQHQTGDDDDDANGPPAKRRRLSPDRDAPPPQAASTASSSNDSSKLLRFEGGRFGKCRSVENYDKLNDIEEGAYGWVARAREIETGKVVALKRLKIDPKDRSGLPVTGLREIQILKDCSHRNIVKLKEVVVGDDTSKIEKYVCSYASLIFPTPSTSQNNRLTNPQQHLHSPRIPRTRPQVHPRRHARALPRLRSEDPPSPALLRHRLPALALHPAPGPQDLQPFAQQPRPAQNRRLRHGPLRARSASSETHPASRHPLVPRPRASFGSRPLRSRNRHVVRRLHLWRAFDAGASLTRKK